MPTRRRRSRKRCSSSEALTFSLDELRYEYPDETIEGFANAQDALTHLTYEGAEQRYPHGLPDKVRASIEHELALIAQLQYAPYFLTVYDIVRFARSQKILCQGRGSAANSAVCFCLGITEVDPERADLLFERFISAERREPPDIDVDFEHERREEVIQYIYGKYGRERAGIAATVISYRGRSAIREVGKAFGLSEDTIGALSSSIWGGGGGDVSKDAITRTGLDPQEPAHAPDRGAGARDQRLPAPSLSTRRRLRHHPQPARRGDADRQRRHARPHLRRMGQGRSRRARHLEDRRAWLGDALLPAQGVRSGGTRRMLSGESALTLSSIPAEDPAVYRMLGRADSLGVFQVESRAQMTMLPRLRPQNFYDLVIEVAIVRPGPIQGDMVHPYLRRRRGEEPVSYPSKELEAVLSKTLGVPLFQEQAMKIAIVAAGFTPSEADRLRRAMATFKRVGTIGTFQRKMIDGMLANGYAREFAERCFQQIEGFGEYGFPESHAASFALLVYASAWLKCRYPDAFAAALLNAQPMGFYAPAQIVRDAREHGVEVRAPDVNFSDWDSTLEPGPRAAERLHDLHREMREDVRATHAIRLGLREIKGLSEEDGRLIVEKRDAFSSSLPPRSLSSPPPLAGEVGSRSDPGGGSSNAGQAPAPSLTLPRKRGREQAEQEARKIPYDSVRDVWLRTGLSPRVLERLADADAFSSLGLTRREALWAAKALGRVGDRDDDLPLFAVPRLTSPASGGSRDRRPREKIPNRLRLAGCPLRGERERSREPDVALPPMPLGEEVVNDYRFLRLSLRAHPAQFLRGDLERRGTLRNEALRSTRQQYARAHLRPGHLPAAAGLGQGRGVHDHRGRKRGGQCDRVAESLRARAPGGAGRALCRGDRPRAVGIRRHPRGGRAA